MPDLAQLEVTVDEAGVIRLKIPKARDSEYEQELVLEEYGWEDYDAEPFKPD